MARRSPKSGSIFGAIPSVPGEPGYDTAALAIGHPMLPYGLRTVDGTYNNLVEGRELWGVVPATVPATHGTGLPRRQRKYGRGVQQRDQQ